jgi:hypothetical protein
MKTNYIKLHILFFLIGMLTVLSQSSFADNQINTDEPDQACSPSTLVTIEVKLDPDCKALEECEWEILVFDISDCTHDTQPIATALFVYGQPPITFNNLTFNNNYVKVCVRQKPGSICVPPNYAPKCQCKPINSNFIQFTIDICTP